MTTHTTPDGPVPTRSLLHVGCGPRNKARLPRPLRGCAWHEIRFDIDPAVAPDIVGSIVDLGMLGDASIDAIYSSHNLEHLDGFDVPRALAEFCRVLRPNGFALLTMPDIRAVAREIAGGGLADALYQSAAGPITPLDMLFGHQAALAAGRHHMAHRTGFSGATLGQALVRSGFHEVHVHEGRAWDLWALATMPATAPTILEDLAGVLA